MPTNALKQLTEQLEDDFEQATRDAYNEGYEAGAEGILNILKAWARDNKLSHKMGRILSELRKGVSR